MAENNFTKLAKIHSQLATAESPVQQRALHQAAAAIYSDIAAKLDSHAAWTGTADRTTKDTATATLVNVAQEFKSLIDDLRA